MSSEEQERFRRKQQEEQEKRRRLEQGAVSAFSEWLGEIAKQFVKKAVHSFWNWLRSMFGSPIPKISARPTRNFCAPRRRALTPPAGSWRACSAHPTQ